MPEKKDCCCTPDDNEGFDFCAVVCCWRQCGTSGVCCAIDQDKQCCACVLCECQFDLLFPLELAAAIVSCVVCCAGKTLFKLGIPATKAGLEVTWEAAKLFGIVGGAAVGGLCGCCAPSTQYSALNLICCAPCTMPCYYADNAALVDGVEDVTSWSVDCAAFAVFMPCCCCGLVSSTKRSELRYALGLKEERCCPLAPDRCGDELTHLCCLPCALVEERKILLKNGCTRERPAVKVHAEIMHRGSVSLQRASSAPSIIEKADSTVETATLPTVELVAPAAVETATPPAEPVMTDQPKGEKI